MSVISMKVEKLSAKLSDKLQNEHCGFAKKSKNERCLNYANEYLIHENFFDEMELINLIERQIRELLAMENWLAYLSRNELKPKTLKGRISSVSSKTILKKNRSVGVSKEKRTDAR